MRKALKEVIQAIESGRKIQDERGFVYTQEFGEKFLDYLKEELHKDDIVYYCDNKRHLVCKPYSLDNLHLMAKELKIKKCWFHINHYDIPVKRMEEIMKRCTVVSSKEIVRIINNQS